MALTEYPVGSLVLPPLSLALKKFDSNDASPYTVIATMTGGYDAKIVINRCEAKTLATPFWATYNTKVHEEEKGNCAITEKTVKGRACTVNPTKNANPEFFIDIPCIVNTKVIKAYDPIVLYVPEQKVTKPKRESGFINIQTMPVEKKAKI